MRNDPLDFAKDLYLIENEKALGDCVENMKNNKYSKEAEVCDLYFAQDAL